MTTYGLNDEGKLVNQQTGEEFEAGPDLPPFEETLPTWLVDQHFAPPPEGVEP